MRWPLVALVGLSTACSGCAVSSGAVTAFTIDPQGNPGTEVAEESGFTFGTGPVRFYAGSTVGGGYLERSGAPHLLLAPELGVVAGEQDLRVGFTIADRVRFTLEGNSTVTFGPAGAAFILQRVGPRGSSGRGHFIGARLGGELVADFGQRPFGTHFLLSAGFLWRYMFAESASFFGS